MKKILILGLCSITTFFFSTKVNAYDSNYSDIETFFEDNLDQMTNSYYNKTDKEWNASKVEEVTDVYDIEDNKIGYLVIFDEGYLTFHNNMSVLEVNNEGYPEFYKSTFSFNKPKVVYHSGSFIMENSNKIETYDNNANNIYYTLYNYYDKASFKITSSMVQIPYFKDKYDSSTWGNYQGISLSYIGEESGGVLATMALMYTLKVNGGVDLTPAKTSYMDFRSALNVYTNFDYDNEPFLPLNKLSIGINNYLKHNFGDRYIYAMSNTVNSTVPAVTLYYNNNFAATANYCMRVGTAQEPDWWIFNTYYDIVMADANNFYYDEYGIPTIWFDDVLEPFFVVNQNYRNEMFQFFEGDTLLK